MKTIIEWFQELPEECREKAISNFRNSYKEDLATSLTGAINTFTWADTPEGNDYWNKWYLWAAKYEAEIRYKILQEKFGAEVESLGLKIDETRNPVIVNDIFSLHYTDEIAAKPLKLLRRTTDLPTITGNNTLKWGYYEGSFNVSPFGNCQMFTLGSFYTFLQYSKKDCISKLKDIRTLATGKRILLVDMQNMYMKKMKEYFGKAIMNIFPYNSTNGSLMNLVQINLTLL